MPCRNRQVLLAGASGGIGQAIARELARAGARLTLVARNAERLDALLGTLGEGHRAIAADLTRPEDRARVRAQCSGTGLDILINALGVMDFSLFEDQRSAAIQALLDTNLVAPILLCHELLPLLHASEDAAIVNIGSIFGSIGHPGFAAYCASKFGLRGFTEALQRELHDSRIHVAYLAPRATRTDLNPIAVNSLNVALGNTTDAPEQVAGEVLRLLGERRRQRFMGWPENLFVRINGLFPGVVHQALTRKLHIIRHHARHPLEESKT